tara:strand:+ start:6112 stop:6303 length:192 start_codon:yes stop_codon:yes gene_type:complete
MVSKGLTQPERDMSYEEFKKEYLTAFSRMMSYSPEQAGSNIYADKMAALADEYPDFAEKAEDE